MTYDANKITTGISKLQYLWQAVEMAWIMQNHNGGDWGVVHDAIVELREQCDLLLSPEYLGDEPQQKASE